ncbi:MAG: M1 family metallopeptidase [Chloroflexi bacterium]|nr:M1 family metallopeptidase [Chloroflexota bacterium]
MHVYRSVPGILLLALLLGACSHIDLPFLSSSQLSPDPLAPYRPAFTDAALPADFDFDATPRYAIELKVDPEQRQVEGVARIHFRNRSGAPMNDVFVRLYPNLPQLVGSMTLTGVTTLPEHFVVGFAFAVNDSAARITLTEPLLPDKSIDLEIKYKLSAPKPDHSGYVLFGESEGILNLPYAYPMLPAQTGLPTQPWRLDIPPSFGDIAITDPALYWVTATVPSEYRLVTTGVEITHTTTTPGWTDHVVVTGLVPEWGMTLSKEFDVAQATVDGVRLNSYYLPIDERAGQKALAQAAAVLRVYDRLFRQYPFTELDIVETPTRYLGMEYPGLNYIGLDTYRTNDDSQELLVAHEISHQWWYNLIGSDPYRYPWFDEGLAEQSTLIYAETIYGPQAADRIRTLRWQIPVQWAVDHGLDQAVGQPVSTFQPDNYETLVYAKAALFFDALYQTLGRETYLHVLQTFIDRYRFRRPTPEDFLQVVTEVSGYDPQPLYEAWIIADTTPPLPDN